MPRDGQPRHDPDPDAGGDQALDGSVVVRAEHDVRVPAGLAEAILDALGRSARAVADQRLVDDLAQARGPVAVGERGSRRDDEDVGVAEELDGLVRPGRKREHDEAQVELAALDELHELLVVGGLAQGDVDLRPLVRELAQQRREDLRADALIRADAQRSRFAGVERDEVGLRGLEARGDRVGVPEQQFARLGERDAWDALRGRSAAG
jgi:hypothetical protein